MLKCKCGCGGNVHGINRYIHGHNTRDFNKELLLQKASHGASNGNYSHGLQGHPLYNVWLGMKQRCCNKESRWGGRGISVCNEWECDFQNFYNWAVTKWKPSLTIDRKDNDGNYTPENCRFVTQQVNANNRGKQCNNTSGFVGVTYASNTHKWNAYIYINRIRKHIGYFISAEEAAIARDKYIKVNKLPHKLNFGGYLNGPSSPITCG